MGVNINHSVDCTKYIVTGVGLGRRVRDFIIQVNVTPNNIIRCLVCMNLYASGE